jgi:hypothetical protein
VILGTPERLPGVGWQGAALSVAYSGVGAGVDCAGMITGHHLRVPTLRIAKDPVADELLGRDPLALVLGMLLDRQMRRRSGEATMQFSDRISVTRVSAAHVRWAATR